MATESFNRENVGSDKSSTAHKTNMSEMTPEKGFFRKIFDVILNFFKQNSNKDKEKYVFEGKSPRANEKLTSHRKNPALLIEMPPEFDSLNDKKSISSHVDNQNKSVSKSSTVTTQHSVNNKSWFGFFRNRQPQTNQSYVDKLTDTNDKNDDDEVSPRL